METLRLIVEDTVTPLGKIFDLFTQTVIIVSLLLFSFETVPELQAYEGLFKLIEYVAIGIFSVEYVLRLLVSRPISKYALSFYGIIDLLAILPFFLTLGVFDFRFLRIFRLFRLLRVFKLTRYSNALIRLRDALTDIKEELVLYFGATLLLIYVSSVGIYYFERGAQPDEFKSIIHSMWWAVSTLTTVGYGDVFPVTIGGKIFTFLILMLGLGLVSVPSALLASSLSSRRE